MRIDHQMFAVFADVIYLGNYEAKDEQHARDLAAQDAGYQSEADMVVRIGPSELAAHVITGEES